MRTISFEQLEARRQKWTPEPMPGVPFDSYEFGIPDALLKCIALGLHLELPVAEWVGTATKKDLPLSPQIKRSLGKNISDEAVHFRGFKYAEAAYPIPQDIYDEAQLIGKAWEEHNAHPLEKAATAEAGVFLCTLFFMTQFGGQSLANLAANISPDEQRHVAFNWGVLEMINIQRQHQNQSLKNLRLETLQFVFGGIEITDLGLDLDFFVEESENLILKGYSRELEALSIHSVYRPPFEDKNSSLY